jgi:hypothetical protein
MLVMTGGQRKWPHGGQIITFKFWEEMMKWFIFPEQGVFDFLFV